MSTAFASSSDTPWWQTAVVYQVYPRSFADSDGDGIGDLRGLIDRLDHIHRLGADVLWVSPFYPSPQADNGYDISDYRDVDPLFGSLDDLDDLIAALHERDMRLVIDVVVNHTSDQHPWFGASRSGRDDPKRDWYWWADPRDGLPGGAPGAEPTNWQAFFSTPAWTWDEATGQYYLHLFTPEQPDLNWEHPEVRSAVWDMLRWWLDRGVDGFRMDVINLVSKPVPLVDAPVGPDGVMGHAGAVVPDGPRVHEFLQEFHREVVASTDKVLLTVGEMPGVTVAEARRYTAADRREVDMVFTFEHMDVDHGPGGRYDPAGSLDLPRLKRTMARWQEGLADEGWNSLYWANHDQPRPVSRFGNDEPQWRAASAKALATILHLHRGTPYVYQGEELGMTNHPFTAVDQYDDVASINAYDEALGLGVDEATALAGLLAQARDHARTPMQWDQSDHAGFTAGTPWMPVNPNHAEVNAAAQADDPDSVFAHYRRLIGLRHDEAVVAHGRFALLAPDHPRLWAFTRTLDDDRLLVLANLSTEALEPRSVGGLDLTGWETSELLLGTGADGHHADASDVLDGWECRVHRVRS